MSQSKLIEQLIKTTGKFDPKKQFAFTNWQPWDFTFKWGGEDYTIKSGEVAVFPQYLAYHACKHFVNKILLDAGRETVLMNTTVRSEYEDKTLKEIAPGEENPYTATIREQEREKLLREMGMDGAGVGITTSESRREAIEASAKFAVDAKKADDVKQKRLEALSKARAAKKEYAEANK